MWRRCQIWQRNWSAVNQVIGRIVCPYSSWVDRFVFVYGAARLAVHIEASSLYIYPRSRTPFRLVRTTGAGGLVPFFYVIIRNFCGFACSPMPRVKPGQRRRAKAPKVRTGCRTCKSVFPWRMNACPWSLCAGCRFCFSARCGLSHANLAIP